MEFKQDDIVVFKKPVTSHDGEKVAGAGTMGKVTVVGIGLHNGDTNGIEVLCEGEGYFPCRPQDLGKPYEPTKYTLTRENYVEVANWIGPDVRISSPWKNPKLHFETGFGEPGFKTTASIGDTIEKLSDGKIQIWVHESNVASDEPPPSVRAQMKKEDRPEMLMPENFGPISEARVLVHKMHYGPSSEIPLALHDVYVVWFCKTLQNWKAMVSSNAKDNAYYEVTHNGDKNETYVDRYVKETNTVYHHETGISDVTLVNNFGRIY